MKTEGYLRQSSRFRNNVRLRGIFLLFFVTALSLRCQVKSAPERSCLNVDLEHSISQGEDFLDANKLDSARVWLKQAVRCSKQAGDEKSEAKSLLLLGKVEFRELSPRDTPTKLFLESLSIYSALEDSIGMAMVNLQLGLVNYEIHNFQGAIPYFQSVLNSNQTEEHLHGLAQYLLAISYSELGYFGEAKEMFEMASNEVPRADSLFHLQVLTFKGKMYSNKGEPEEAIRLFEEAFREYSALIHQEKFTPIYAFLAKAHLQMGNHQAAIEYARYAYQHSLGRGATALYLRDAEETLHEAFYAQEKIDSAYFYLKALNALVESTMNDRVLQRLTEMSGQFEYQQKLKAQESKRQMEMALNEKKLEQERLQRNILLGGFLLVLVFAAVFYQQRKKIARERNRSESLLLNILPKNIAAELKEHGRAEAKEYENVSILFTDFVAFTQESARLNAKELVEEINACFEAFDQITTHRGIEKIKTIGDAYMAAGGLAGTNGDSAKNTVLAAIDMQDYMRKRAEEKRFKKEPFFEMRLGIHTGPVVAGIVGVKKFQYDVWGDTVNTANRLENTGQKGKVNISKATYDLVKNEPEFSFENRGKVVVKGKGEMEMWFVSHTL